jgi:hypothetical protein
MGACLLGSAALACTVGDADGDSSESTPGASGSDAGVDAALDGPVEVPLPAQLGCPSSALVCDDVSCCVLDKGGLGSRLCGTRDPTALLSMVPPSMVQGCEATAVPDWMVEHDCRILTGFGGATTFDKVSYAPESEGFLKVRVFCLCDATATSYGTYEMEPVVLEITSCAITGEPEPGASLFACAGTATPCP